MLRLEGHWVWDSWIADDGEGYHLFFLKAPRSLGSPGHRHSNAVIGHAVSTDLVEWTELPDALGPLPGAWDDLALWTGSVVRGDDDVWRLYYTAISTRGHELKDQRVGLAESDDLVDWRRVGEQPLLTADADWYKTLDEDPTASETWRDPLVFRDPDGDGWHMYVTARLLGSPRNADGVLAHATSPDMRTWTLRAPACEPGGFGQIEVPQVQQIDGTWVLVFTCHPDEQSDAQRARFGDFSTWSLTGDSPLGPWHLDDARPFEAEPDLFAAPLVRRRDGSWALIGFRNLEPKGIDAFDIVDPIPVVLRDGRLVGRSSDVQSPATTETATRPGAVTETA